MPVKEPMTLRQFIKQNDSLLATASVLIAFSVYAADFGAGWLPAVVSGIFLAAGILVLVEVVYGSGGNGFGAVEVFKTLLGLAITALAAYWLANLYVAGGKRLVVIAIVILATIVASLVLPWQALAPVANRIGFLRRINYEESRVGFLRAIVLVGIVLVAFALANLAAWFGPGLLTEMKVPLAVRMASYDSLQAARRAAIPAVPEIRKLPQAQTPDTTGH